MTNLGQLSNHKTLPWHLLQIHLQSSQLIHTVTIKHICCNCRHYSSAWNEKNYFEV